jgi:uncharacterized protein
MKPVIVSTPSLEEISAMMMLPVWEHDVATFLWHYDEKETCFLLEGDVTVKTGEGEYRFNTGDMVEFAEGLDCEWIIHKRVRKHYVFG